MSFKWVPANATPSTLDLDLYITYEKNKVKEPTAKGEGKTIHGGYKRSIIKCPDRTLILATNPNNRPLDTSFDEHLSLSAFRDNNPFDEIGIGLVCSAINPTLSKNPIIPPKNHILIGDSGGFQIASGKKDYVDPYEIINWMNINNITDAASIDIFPRYNPHDGRIIEELVAGAKITRDNNAIYKRYRRDGLRIINVIHGATAPQQRFWANTVADDDLESWAVGSDSKSIYVQLSGVAVLRDMFPKKHYHIFGVSSTEISLVLCWLGKYVPLLTSDSTTHFRGAVNKEVPFMDIHGVVSRKHVGNKGSFVKSGVLPSSCPVCSRVKYLSVFGMDAKYKVDRLSTWHSMFVMTRQTNYWNAVAENSSSEEYKQAIAHALKTDAGSVRVRRIKNMIDFIDMSIKDSVENASDKYKHVMFPVRAEYNISQMVERDYREEEDEHIKTIKSTMKTRDNTKVSPWISVDVLPHYTTSFDLWNNFDIDIVNDKYCKVFREHKNKLRNKIIKDKGSAEVLDRQYIRKHPYTIMGELRSKKLERKEKRDKHNKRKES